MKLIVEKRKYRSILIARKSSVVEYLALKALLYPSGIRQEATSNRILCLIFP